MATPPSMRAEAENFKKALGLSLFRRSVAYKCIVRSNYFIYLDSVDGNGKV